jgi:hypothetical protein
MRTLLDSLEKEAKDEGSPQSLSQFERKRASFFRDRTRAGQAPPGETKGPLRLSQGALARPEHRTRRTTSNIPEEPKSLRYTFSNIYGGRT